MTDRTRTRLLARASGRDAIAAATLLFVAVAYLILALRLPQPVRSDALGPASFPIAVSIALIVCALLLFFPNWTSGLGIAADPDEEGSDIPHVGQTREALVAILAIATFVICWPYVGPLLSTAVFIFAAATYHHPSSWRLNLTIGILFSAAITALFDFGLGISLPGPDVSGWFGL